MNSYEHRLKLSSSNLVSTGGKSYPAEALLSMHHRLGVHDDLQDVCVLLFDRVVPHAILALVTSAVQRQLLPYPAEEIASEGYRSHRDAVHAANVFLPYSDWLGSSARRQEHRGTLLKPHAPFTPRQRQGAAA